MRRVRKQEDQDFGVEAMISDAVQTTKTLLAQLTALAQAYENEETAEDTEEAAEGEYAPEEATVAKSRKITRDIAPAIAGVGLFARETPRRMTDEEFVRQISARQER